MPQVTQMEETGVVLAACKACADRCGVAQILVSLGVEPKYMGQLLTEIVKGDWVVTTFWSAPS